MNRRSFTKALTTGSLLLGQGFFIKLLGSAATYPLGIISGSIGPQLKNDAARSFKLLKKAGIQTIEFGGIPENISEAEYLKLLKKNGIRPVAGGSNMKNILSDPNRYIEYTLSHEKEYLVCYWPWMSSADNLTPDEVNQAIENINRMGDKCYAQGLQFAVHNHNKEFLPMGEGTIYDLFCQQTDPEKVVMEIDLYWVYQGKADPLTYFERYPGRFPLWHVKDQHPTTGKSVPPGEGNLDFDRLFAAAKQAGLKYPIMEFASRDDRHMHYVHNACRYLKPWL